MGLRRWIAATGLLVGLGAQHVMAQDCDVFEYSPFNQVNRQGACSGLGVCLDGVNCQCNPGFTGLSDIINTDGIDCQVNINLLKGFWVLNLLIALGLFTVSVPRILGRYKNHQQLKRLRQESGRKLTWRNNRALAANLVGSVGCTVFMTLFALLQIAKEDERIGVTFGATFLFAITRTCFYAAVWLYQPALLRSTLTGKRSTRRIVEYNDKVAFVNCAFAAVISYAPFFCFLEDDGTGPIHVAAYYVLIVGTMLQLIFFGFEALYVDMKVKKVLLESYRVSPSQSILDLSKAISETQTETFRQCVAQFCIYAAFAFSGRLLNAHVYFLPFGWLAYVILGKRLSFTHIRITGSSESSKRSGTTVDSYANGSSFKQNMESSYGDSTYQSTLNTDIQAKSLRESSHSPSYTSPTYVADSYRPPRDPRDKRTRKPQYKPMRQDSLDV
mmetsp:Transcript_9033/g.15892  ORF Transcript_9033/g.15892 Transcript_9033/m.15892 type:complete len:443 (-) Transcript_9033:243-1571(-)